MGERHSSYSEAGGDEVAVVEEEGLRGLRGRLVMVGDVGSQVGRCLGRTCASS